MNFETGHLYHIYNQGNNRQKIFFNRNNYLFFLKKIKTYVDPFTDILAWCLMPNHFHIMVHYNGGTATQGVTQSHPLSNPSKAKSLNDSIGIMLRSYTRAINKQEQRTGSLFREETKAICLTCCENITPVWYNSMGIVKIDDIIPEKQYPNICFNYILTNPVKSGFVIRPEEWEFSSYRDYKGLRDGKMISRLLINEYGLALITDLNS
jgi:putative transposase